MKTVKIIAALVILIMGANAVHVALASGMNHGVGLDTFLAGTGSPWQVFINTDLVAGLMLTVSWMIYRERGGRAIDTIAWVWLALWWGNIVVAAYVLRAANQSGGDWTVFFMGRQSRSGPAIPAVQAPAAMRVLAAAVALGVLIYLAKALAQSGISSIAIAGYVAGFVPIILAAMLLAFGRNKPG